MKASERVRAVIESVKQDRVSLTLAENDIPESAYGDTIHLVGYAHDGLDSALGYLLDAATRLEEHGS